MRAALHAVAFAPEIPLTTPSDLSSERLCALAALAATAAFAAGLLTGGSGSDGFQLAARFTARLAFFGFLPVYLASSWNTLRPTSASRWAVKRRRSLGLAFATLHTIHFGALLGFQWAAAQVPDLPTLVVGGGAYGMMFAMVATSSDRAVRRMGIRRWRRLHRLGIHWLWFVFAFSYASRVAQGMLGFVPLLVLAVGALGLRLAAARRRNTTPSPAAAAAALGSHRTQGSAGC